MSLLNTIHITEKTHNGLLWGTLFGITMIPLQLGIHHKLIKKLNTNEEFKYKISKETLKKINLAMEDFNKCISLDPKYPESYWNKSLLHQKYGPL